MDWQEMLRIHQELSQFARAMLVNTQKQFLTSSERELLAGIYLMENNCTPLQLSQASGMKKEAVSRSLKCLYEKGCIEREKSFFDERSYSISLTPIGEKSLKNDYEIMLKKYYDLYQEMGKDFDLLFKMVIRANGIMAQGSDDDEIL